MRFLGILCSVLFCSMKISTGIEFDINRAIDQTYQGILERNEYREPFLIHRPFSETPRDAVSEGVGYGMLLALYQDDQPTFDRLLEGAEQTMWNGDFYDWRVNEFGARTATGAATDAEQDIAFALLKASEKTNWDPNPFYKERALKILRVLWERGVDNGILRPGYYWGGAQLINPGYFSPAWYREFAKQDPSRPWLAMVEKTYEILEKSPGYSKGLIPDWMNSQGGQVYDLGYNAYGGGTYLYKDAIRVFWRIGMDALWHEEERALTFLKKAYLFSPDIRQANFFQMNGNPVPKGDIWIFDGGNRQRPRQEHSPLTVGMWAIPIWVWGSEQEKTLVLEEFAFFFPDSDQTYWGRIENEVFPLETIDHNEMYFEQFLASFGAMFVANRWN